VTAYLAGTVVPSASCIAQVRTCDGNALSGTYTFQHCKVGPGANACTLSAAQGGGVLANGASMTAYGTVAVDYPDTCTAHTLTCSNTVLSCNTGTISDCKYEICSQNSGGFCWTPWGTKMNYRTDVTAYLNSTEPVGGACTSQTRSC